MGQLVLDCRKLALRRAIELRNKFFHCCIFAGNFTSLSTVQSYLCGDGASENLLINIAKRPRHEASQPTDPSRGMGVADNDARAKHGEPRTTHCGRGMFPPAPYSLLSDTA